MDSKERVPDYRMKCSLDDLDDLAKCLAELTDKLKRDVNVEIDFYITDKESEKEFKGEMYKWYGIPRM